MLQSPHKIADKEHNKFLNETSDHQTTQAAPRSLLQPFDNEQKQRILSRYAAIDVIVRELIGEPFFSEDGFILYSGDCVGYLSRLAKSELRANLTITSP